MAYDAGSETYRLVKERRRGKKRGLGESAARVAGAAFISGEGVDWVEGKLRKRNPSVSIKAVGGKYCVFLNGKDTGKWASTESKAKEIAARFGSVAPPPPVAPRRVAAPPPPPPPAPRRTASPGEKVIGFTGTREGMTHRQKATVLRLFIENMPFTFVHGDCVGADDNAHDLAIRVGAPVVQRPCTLTSQRAFGAGAKKVYPPKPPLDRNREIVTGSDLMIATPKGFVEEQRGGTWYTIRYARQTETPLIIVWPDGSTGS